MTRDRIPSIFLALLVVGALLVGCGGGKPAGPTPTPTVDPYQRVQTSSGAGTAMLWKPQVDMRPVVKSFLANVPDTWGLLPPQSVVPNKTILVDVRQPEEYQTGFIPGAINIPLRELTKSLQALPAQDKEVVMVCDTGARGAVAMVVLQLLGW